MTLVFLMPSSQSLWIDEAYTARLAEKPRFADLVRELYVKHPAEDQRESLHGGESLMPLSMASDWMAAKILGTSEWRLRAVNILWGCLAVVAFFHIGQRLGMPWLPLLLGVHPYFWYYMNEARPYAMQMAAGAWLFFSVVEFLQNEGRGSGWAAGFSIAGFILCGSNLLGVIPFGMVALVLLNFILRNRWWPSRIAVAWILACCLALIPLGTLYLWSLAGGASGAKLWPVSAANIGFSLYELLGFSGLGPPRHLMRELAANSKTGLFPVMLHFPAGLVSLAIAYVVAIVQLIENWPALHNKKILGTAALIFATTLAVLLALASAVRWPFWGRHLAPVFGFLVGGLGLCLQSPDKAKNPASGRFVLIGFFVFFALSSANLRFNPAYQRDDYRSAAKLANREQAAGKTVWWSADLETAAYYHVEFGGKFKPHQIVPVINSTAEDAAALLKLCPPDLMVLTKPDIYDNQGALAEITKRAGWRIVANPTAFVIYGRQENYSN